MIKFLSVISILCVFFLSFGQREDSYVDSKEFIQKGYNYYEEEEYSKAIESYKHILEGDTNYNIALYEISLAYMKLEEYDSCRAVCLRGLEKDSSNADLYVTLARSYIGEKKYPKSREILDFAIQEFPMNYLFNFNKALSYYNEENWDMAIQEYMKTLEKNPYYGAAHIQLGLLSNEAGEYTQSALSLLTYVLIFPESSYSGELLEMLETSLTEKKTESSKDHTFSKSGDDFDDIDEALLSQVALSKKFQTESELDFKLFRQTQLILAMLKDYEPGDGFYDRFYVPFYQSLYESGVYSGYTYYMVSGLNSDAVKKLVTKHSKEVGEFSNWLKETGLPMFRTNKDGNYMTYYDYPYPTNGVGKTENGDPEGNWTFYKENGSLMSKGDFNEEGKNGLWKWYYNNTDVSEEITLKDGKRDGAFVFYYKNGNKRDEGTYKDNLYNGQRKTYYKQGGVSEISKYKEGKLDSTGLSFYPNGQVHYRIDFKDGKQDGKFLSYYPNGQVEYDYENKENLKEGTYTLFDYNGQKLFEGTYKEGLLEGPFKRYYNNGKLKFEGTAVKDNYSGAYKEYYSNGNIHIDGMYDESGKYSGVKKEYDPLGHLHEESEYVKGEQVSYKSFDLDGNIIDDIKVKNNASVSVHYNTGEKYSEGKYNRGERNGKWVYYFRNGQKSLEANYKNGKFDGEQLYYFMNGQLKAKSNYKEGLIDGYYKSYNIFGELVSEGYYAEDERVGLWKYYDEFGNIKGTEYYVGGLLNGPDKSFDIEGKIDQINYYEFDELVQMDYYHKGTNYQTVDFSKLKEKDTVKENSDWAGFTKSFGMENGEMYGPFTQKLKDGSLLFEGEMLNGERNGTWKWYNPLTGKLDYQANYNYGLLDGEIINYSIFGYLYSKANLQDDDYEGERTRFFPNGNKLYTETYFEDELYGPKKYYGPNGDVMFSVYYMQDDPVFVIQGEDTTIIESTKKTYTFKYPNGKTFVEMPMDYRLENGTFKYYNEDGTLLYESNVKNDKLHGERIIYFTNGKINTKENYENGEEQGTFEKYDENGNKLMECNFKNGVKHGKFVLYNSDGSVIKELEFYNGFVVK